MGSCTLAFDLEGDGLVPHSINPHVHAHDSGQGISNPEQAPGVLVEEFSFDGLARRQAANGCDGLRSLATWPAPNGIITITPKQQLFLMSLQKAYRVSLIAKQCI